MGNPVNGDYFLSPFGFSANPCLCNSRLLKEGFMEMMMLKKEEQTKLIGFENYLTTFMQANQYYNLLKLNGDNEFVSHSGFLESTAREYHMINSLDAKASSVGKEYISGMGSDKKVSFLNKTGMLFKLWLSSFYLSFKLFKSRQAYDYAFRIYSSYLKDFRL
jgi:hypothetical protein